MIIFEVMTPLGFIVQVSDNSWRLITEIKHPVMKGKEAAVQATLKDPEVIRRSRSDDAVYLYYRHAKSGLWLCTVVKRLNGHGFLITAYLTDAIKEGEVIWTK